MEKRYYLAYGSNLNMEQMFHRCPTAKVVGTSELMGYKLLCKGINGRGFLTIEPKIGSSVPVGVWEVQAEDEERLDMYEGYPTHYYKRELTLPVKNVETGKTRTCRAFIYIMNDAFPLEKPSPRYVQVCCEGYMDFGFDLDGLLEACGEIL